MFIGLGIDQRVVIGSCNMKLFSNVTGSQRVITSYHHNLITKHTHAHIVLMVNKLAKPGLTGCPLRITGSGATFYRPESFLMPVSFNEIK